MRRSRASRASAAATAEAAVVEAGAAARAAAAIAGRLHRRAFGPAFFFSSFQPRAIIPTLPRPPFPARIPILSTTRHGPGMLALALPMRSYLSYDQPRLNAVA